MGHPKLKKVFIVKYDSSKTVNKKPPGVCSKIKIILGLVMLPMLEIIILKGIKWMKK